MPATAGIQGERQSGRPRDSRLRGSDEIGKRLMHFRLDEPFAEQ